MPELPPLVAELRVQASDVHAKFAEAMHASDDLAKKTTSDSSTTGSAFDKLGRVGQIAFGAVTTGIGTVIGESAHMAADFQEKMTLLVTGAGESKDKVDGVAQGILDMAPKVETSTSQLADGMYMIESAGFHGASGLSMLQAAAEGAKTGNADLGTTADALTTVMKDYHIPTQQAADTTSKLIATVASGKTHMQDLAGSMASILPFSSGLGVSLNDTLGAMATMTGNGIQADQAATYLKFSMMALANETPKGTKALTDVGLSSIQVATDLKKKGLSGTLAEITDAIGKKFPAGSAQYNAALSDIVGGTRGMAAALALTGGNAKTYTDNIKNIGGATADADGSVKGFKETSEDLNNKLAGIGATFEALGIRIGTALIPMLTQGTTDFMNMFNFLSSHQGILIALAAVVGSVLSVVMVAFFAKMALGMVNNIKDFSKMTMTMVKGVGTVVTGFGDMAKGMGDAMGGLEGAYGKMGAFGGQIAGLTGRFGSAASAAGSWAKDTAVALGSNTKALALNTLAWFKNDAATRISTIGKTIAAAATRIFAAAQAALDAVMDANPIMLIVIAIAALVAGFIWAYNSLGWFKDGVNAVLTFVSQAFQNVVNFIGSVLGVLGSMWSGFWNGPFGHLVQEVWALIIAIIQFAVAWMMVAIRSALSFITSVWMAAWNGVVGALRGPWNVIVSIITVAVNFIRSIITSYLNMVFGVWSAIWGSVSAFFIGIWNGIVGFIAGVWASIFGTVSGGVGATSGAVNSGLNTIFSFFSSIWNNVVSFLNGVWGNIVSAVTGGIGNVVSVVSGLGAQIMGAIGGIAGQMLSAGANIVSSLAQGIMNGIGAVANAIGNIVQTISDHMPHSPAKTGPLSGRGYTLYSGQKMVADLALGMAQNLGGVEDAAFAVAGAASGGLDTTTFGRSAARAAQVSGPGVPGPQQGQSTGGNQTVNYITVDVQSNADPQQIARELGYQMLLQG